MDKAGKMDKAGRFRRQWEFFESKRSRLARRYHGKFVIIFNEKIHAVEDSEIAAHKRARNDGLMGQGGRLYIRRCIFKNEEVPTVVRTRTTGGRRSWAVSDTTPLRGFHSPRTLAARRRSTTEKREKAPDVRADSTPATVA